MKTSVKASNRRSRSVTNYVLRERQQLKKQYYILKASAERAYWFNISKGKLEKYIATNRGKFYIVVAGDEFTEGDFYAMPFSAIKDLLTEETLADSKNQHERWIGLIRNHRLKISHADAVDIGDYYGRLPHGPKPVTPQTEEEENDFAIENRTVEIKQRLKQSVFRQRVLENFTGRCCLTGITEPELLVASHIVPWAKRVDSRLDPGNGLCLSVLVDRLFDEGFITFDDSLRVIATPHITSLSKPLREVVKDIEGRQAACPARWKVKREYLAYHRKNVFRG